MMQAGPKKGTRALETTIEVAAPVEAVWKALTEGNELARWFPIEAEVEPRVGGKVRLKWGELMIEQSIEAWEPNKHLRAVGWHSEPPGPGKEIVVDYFLEHRGGKTVLRLVHSGFGTGSEWDNEFFDGVRRGWQFELRGLRHYLENHRGKDRRIVYVVTPCRLSADETWKRLMSAKGFLREGSVTGLKEGERYALRAANGDVFAGVVAVNEPGVQFSGTVEGMNNALFRIELESCTGGPAATLVLSTYGMAKGEVEAFEERWKRLLGELLKG